MNEYYLTYRLGWAKDQQGFKSRSSIEKMNTSFRLKLLLENCALMAYVKLSHDKMESSKSALYYEQNTSFLSDILLDLVAEIQSISSSDSLARQEIDKDLFTTSEEQVVANKNNIVMLAKFLLGESAVAKEEHAALFDLFSFGSVGEFFKAVFMFKFAASSNRIPSSKTTYTSNVFPLPVLGRKGYEIEAKFFNCAHAEDITGAVMHVPADVITIDGDIETFVSFLSFQDSNTTDAHLGVLSGCALSMTPPANRHNSHLVAISGLRSIIRQNRFLLSDKLIRSVSSGTMEMFDNNIFTNASAQTKLIYLIARVYENTGTPIGPITTKILNTFVRLGVCSKQSRETSMQLFGLTTNGSHVISTEGYAHLDVNSPLFSPPTNIFYGLEAEGVEDEEEDPEVVEEDTEESPEEEEGGDDATGSDDPKEEPPEDPEEGSEDDPKEEPKQDPTKEKPPIKVAVPAKSVLLQTRSTATDQLEEYLYLVEVYNLIRHVLNNEAVKLTEEDTRILSVLSTEFMFTLTPAAVESIVNSVIKIVPKTEKQI